jgi:S1-C subfamily serine protease
VFNKTSLGFGLEAAPDGRVQVVRLKPNGYAQQMGVQANSTVVSIEGHAFNAADDVVEFVRMLQTRGKPFRICFESPTSYASGGYQ